MLLNGHMYIVLVLLFRKLSSSGFLLMDNKIAKAITKGDIVYIPENEFHGIRNSGNCDLEYLFIFTTDKWENIKYNFRKNEN